MRRSRRILLASALLAAALLAAYSLRRTPRDDLRDFLRPYRLVGAVRNGGARSAGGGRSRPLYESLYALPNGNVSAEVARAARLLRPENGWLRHPNGDDPRGASFLRPSPHPLLMPLARRGVEIPGLAPFEDLTVEIPRSSGCLLASPRGALTVRVWDVDRPFLP